MATCEICGKKVRHELELVQELMFGDTIFVCDDCLNRSDDELTKLERKMFKVLEGIAKEFCSLHERAVNGEKITEKDLAGVLMWYATQEVCEHARSEENQSSS